MSTEVFSRFSLKNPKIGYIFYVSSVQYFFVQLIVASKWSPPYSLGRNTISDLGNTVCGSFNNRFICSPLHNLMNLSFLVLGLAMIIGSLLIYPLINKNLKAATGFLFVAAGGFGTILVGLFPENSVPALHGLGAALPFLIGNLGILVLSAALIIPKWLKIYTLLTALIALIALGFYSTNHFLGLGEGGIERLVAYPQTVWLIVLGLYGLYFSSESDRSRT